MVERASNRAESYRAGMDGLRRARKVRSWKADPLSAPRPFGTMRGQITLAADFDSTPDDLIAAMEGIEPAPSR